MSANKKYFYMKLSENFFDSEKLILLDSYGHEFVLILLRMYLRSLKEGGRLAISEGVPYTEKTLSKVLKCSTKRLKQAIEHLTKLDLIYIDDTGVIWMTDFEQYVGTSTSEAERKRSYRHRMRSQTGSEPLPWRRSTAAWVGTLKGVAKPPPLRPSTGVVAPMAAPGAVVLGNSPPP